MRVFFGALSLAFVTACMPDGGGAPGGDNDAVGRAADKAAPDEIIGKYVVSYVNGARPTINIAGHEPTITIGAERIHFQSQCIYADWTYKRDAETISTEPYFVPSSGMCARGLAPGETAIQEAFGKASSIRRTSGGLQVGGGGYQLELSRVDTDFGKVRR